MMKPALPFSIITTLALSALALPLLAQNAPVKAPAKSPLQWPVRSNDAAPAGREIAEQAPRARAILEAWEKTNPVRGDRILRIVYWTPADREPAPRFRERLSEIMLDIQAWYGREMARNGFPGRTFKLPVGPDGLLDIVVARGDKSRPNYSGETGGEIRADSEKALKAKGITANDETILIFCNLTDWDPEKRTAGGSSPYYAGGTTRSGTAWQSDAPILNLADITNVKEEDKVSGQYGKTTLGRFNSIFIGGIAHELGHALSMPHDVERPDQAGWGKALMGSGNRTYGEELRSVEVNESKGKGSFLPLADALRLASHPSFSGSIKGLNLPANAKLSDVKITTSGKDITYSGRVAGDPPVYAVIAYFDPAGGGDYDATTASAVPDKQGRFTLSTTALTPGRSGELRVVALQANGASDSQAYPYAVRRDGTVDLSQWNTQQQLEPLAAAVKANDRAGVEAALKKLEAENAPKNILEIARVQLAAFDKKPLPTPAEAAGDRLFLSEAKPSEAKVGWLRPTYNRLPSEGNSPLLAAGGKYYARGIFAHAPARHVYDLGGKWKRLTGIAGAPEGKDPSVVFVIAGDGKELWRSKMIRQGQTVPFGVDVQGVTTLELRVEDGGNGNGNDWAAWFDPELTR